MRHRELTYNNVCVTPFALCYAMCVRAFHSRLWRWLDSMVCFYFCLVLQRKRLPRTFEPRNKNRKKKWVKEIWLPENNDVQTNELNFNRKKKKIYALLLSFAVAFFSACLALLLLKHVLMYSIQSTNRSCMQYGIITYPSFVRTLHTYTLKSLNCWRYMIVVRRAKEEKKTTKNQMFVLHSRRKE